MKKIIGLLMLAIFVLFGCSSVDATTEYQGVTITVATYAMNEDNPYSPEAIEAYDPEKIAARQAMLDEFQEETGITIEYIPLAPDQVVEEVSKSVLAGDPIADVVHVYGQHFEELLSAGMLTDISDVVNPYLESSEVDNEAPFTHGMAYGAYYGVPVSLYLQPHFLVYDMALLEQAGMTETPLDMFLADNWTWSTAEAYMKEVDAALGDSIDAVWGDEPRFIFQYGLGSNGVTPIDSEGNLNFTSEAAYEAIEYYKGLYDDGILRFYLDENGAPIWADPQMAWEQGYVESTPDQESGQVVFTTLENWRSDCCVKESDKEYGFVPYPRNDDITKEEFVVPQPNDDMYVVPKGVENPEAAAEVAIFLHEMLNYGTYGSETPQTAEEYYAEWFSTNSSEENNEVVAVYAAEQMQLDKTHFFLLGIDFSFAQALADYYSKGVSISASFDAVVPLIEQNVAELEEKVTGDPTAIE